MRTITMIPAILVFALTQTGTAASDSGDMHKKENSKGLTVDELGRGLKSAAKNIENEIPKIGPAIGETVKKITGGNAEKNTESQSKEKK